MKVNLKLQEGQIAAKQKTEIAIRKKTSTMKHQEKRSNINCACCNCYSAFNISKCNNKCSFWR